MHFAKTATALLGASSLATAWSPSFEPDHGIILARDAMLDSIETYYDALASRDLDDDDRFSVSRRAVGGRSMNPFAVVHKALEAEKKMLEKVKKHKEKANQPEQHDRRDLDDDYTFSLSRRAVGGRPINPFAVMQKTLEAEKKLLEKAKKHKEKTEPKQQDKRDLDGEISSFVRRANNPYGSDSEYAAKIAEMDKKIAENHAKILQNQEKKRQREEAHQQAEASRYDKNEYRKGRQPILGTDVQKTN